MFCVGGAVSRGSMGSLDVEEQDDVLKECVCGKMHALPHPAIAGGFIEECG